MPDYNNRVLGHYRLLRRLGQGGFADVYLGEHIHLKTYASIKIQHSQLAEDGMKHFLAEARMLASLKHPNIVPVLDFGVEEMTPYLVMQYAPNGTLRQRHPRGVPVALNVVDSYVQQIASALQYAHNQKLIHRDVKPENMLIGDQNQLLLSDFGIAILSASARTTPDLDSSWVSGGTASYMAPEQIQAQPVAASDQYALAVVAYEWLTGELPFHGSYMEILMQQMAAPPPPLRGKVPSIALEVEQVILTALQKDVQRRFGHIQAFAHALKLAALDLEQTAVSNGPTKNSEASGSSGASGMEATLVGPFGRLLLGATKVTIGRSSESTIVLDDAKASFHHAELRQEGPGYRLIDLGSINGTLVNEQPIAYQRMLQPGDLIRIGDTKLLFDVRPAVLPSSSLQQSAIETLPPRSLPPTLPGQISHPGLQSASQPPFSETQIPTHATPQQPASTPVFQTESGIRQPLPPGPMPPEYRPSYTPVLSQPPRKRFPLLRTIVLIALALVVILGGVVGTLVYRNQSILKNKNATATVQAQHQLQAQQQATGTALAQQQATATIVGQLQATGTAQATSAYPPFAKLAFIDPLTKASTTWSEGAGCHSSSTGLQVSIATGHDFLCSRTGIFGEMAYQATMTITQGDCGGLFFRSVDPKSYSVFLVCQDGTYDLFNFVAGQGQDFYPSNRATSAIHQGVNQQNVIAVTIQANTISVYINEIPVDTKQEAVLTSTLKQGEIGLYALATNDTTLVSYTNATVWTT